MKVIIGVKRWFVGLTLVLVVVAFFGTLIGNYAAKSTSAKSSCQDSFRMLGAGSQYNCDQTAQGVHLYSWSGNAQVLIWCKCPRNPDAGTY
jgi:hypothetical protein